MKKTAIMALLFTLTLSTVIETYAQCDDENFAKLKKNCKRERDCINKADIAVMIAECYQQQENAGYKEWLELAVNNYKEGYKHCDRSRKAKALYQIAFCYYKLNHNKSSEIFFAIAIKAGYPHPIAYYYYGQTLYMQEQYKDALNQFYIFKNKTDGNPDVDYLIGQCREKIPQ